MRSAIATVGCALAACSSPPPAPKAVTPAPPAATAPADPWSLAPRDTQYAIVADMTGYARLGELARWVAPDLNDAVQAQLARSFLLADGVAPADIGLAADGRVAVFLGPWGSLELWPVTDDARFRTRRGEHADQHCRTVSGWYACGARAADLDLLGDGPALVPATFDDLRPDVVVVVPTPPAPLTRLATPTGAATAVLQLDEGVVIARARMPATTSTGQRALVRQALQPAGNSVSAVVALDLMRHSGLHHQQGPEGQRVLESLGATRIEVPAGGAAYRVTIGLREPRAVGDIVARCGSLGDPMFRNQRGRPGECLVTGPWSLAAWVDGAELVLGARRAPRTTGLALPPTPLSTRLTAHPWTAAFWMRGSTLPTPELIAALIPDPAAEASIANIVELGYGLDVTEHGLDATAFVRTSFAEPDAVTAAYGALASIAAGPDRRAAIAAFLAEHPDSPLADDLRAGGAGVPAAIMGTSLIVVPLQQIYSAPAPP